MTRYKVEFDRIHVFGLLELIQNAKLNKEGFVDMAFCERLLQEAIDKGVKE